MSKIGAWCEVCKSKTHDTKDCWGPGTICVGNAPEPIFRPATVQFPTDKKVMSPELQSAIDKITSVNINTEVPQDAVERMKERVK